jgi:hypothetical protein
MFLIEGKNTFTIAQRDEKVNEENGRYLGTNCGDQTLIMCEHDDLERLSRPATGTAK